MNDDRVPLFCVILQLVHDLSRDRLFSPQIAVGFTHVFVELYIRTLRLIRKSGHSSLLIRLMPAKRDVW